MKKQKVQSPYIIGCLFSILILFLAIAGVISRDRKVSEMENRQLAQKPKMTLETVLSGDYQKEYEEYYNDQFVFRNTWIKVKTATDRLLGKREENGVYIGKNGYLIQKFQEPDEKTVEATMQAIEAFCQKHKDLKQYGMIVPTAENILEDKLPAFAPVVNQDSYIDQTYREWERNGITPIDVREALKKEINEKIYYKTDHHWTTYGAYLAFRQLGEAAGIDAKGLNFERLPVSEQFQGTLSAKSGVRTAEKEELDIYLPRKNTNTTGEQLSSIVEYTDQQEKSASFYKVDKLKQRNAYEVFFGGNHGLMKIKTPTEENRRLLVIKDSYANCFLPFLAPYYREIVVVDPRYYYEDLESLMTTEQINEVLYLYSADTFYADTSIVSMMEE